MEPPLLEPGLKLLSDVVVVPDVRDVPLSDIAVCGLGMFTDVFFEEALAPAFCPCK